MMILLSIPELLLSILKFLTNRTPYRILPITIIITLFCCFLSSAQDEQSYDNCKHQFECGDPSVLGELKYPFWGINRESYCGQPGFELTCINNIPVITNSTYNLEVIGTDPQHNKMTVSMADFSNSLCPSTVVSRQLTNLSIFELFSDNFCIDTSNNYRILTILYGCPSELGHHLSWSSEDPCSTNASVNVHFVTDTVNSSISSKCLYVAVLPILQQNVQHLDDNPSSLADVLDQGFEMKWTTQQDKECQSCMESGGECGFRWDVLNFTCYCPDKTKSMICSQPTQGVTIGGVALLSLLGGYLLIFQKFKPNLQNQNVEDSLKIYASLVPKRYTYRSIKKITKSFREKLGEGGFGIVFKGNLEDGRAVAVKLWKQSKGDGQDFINEVMSMSRTSHVNVVPLFGFCFEGHKRALIYDFMPNGSLEKFIQVRYTNENNKKLCAQKLFEIAIGIARGLEYLHRGCNTRIVHFDIKPHNILLDEEFIPKISDFGLAKSCPQKASIISMSGARGTAGYIAPEVFFRMYGGVSHKSDVYSFGMMVLEMVGCKNKVNDNAQNSSEMYFPDWIYKQLEQGTSVLNCEIILNEEDKGLERKMILVGLSCIQTNPMSRPSMSRVVEMLEGKVELLEVPPMPTLASPPKLHQSTNTFSSSFHS